MASPNPKGLKRKADTAKPRSTKKPSASDDGISSDPFAESDADTPPRKKAKLPHPVEKGDAEKQALAQYQSTASSGTFKELIPLPSSVISRLEDSWTGVAFIMDFSTTAELRAFYTRRIGQTRAPGTASVIESWWTVRDANFDLLHPSLALTTAQATKYSRILRNIAMETGLNPTPAQEAVLCATVKPSVLGENPAVSPNRIAVMSMVWHCVQLMQATARDFPQSAVTTDRLQLNAWELFSAMMVLNIFSKKAKNREQFRRTRWNKRWETEAAYLPEFEPVNLGQPRELGLGELKIVNCS